jgi:uncharacterized membrane protein YgdD (TMEM256/DUF423 family)
MEWQVVAYLMIAALAMLGIALLWASTQVPPDKAQLGTEAFRIGWYCVVGSLLALFGWQTVKRLA